MMYGFEPGKVPRSYEKITWQERRERIPNDYGPPQDISGRKWFSSKEEERAYYDELLTIQEQGGEINF